MWSTWISKNSVAPASKAEARRNVIEAVNDIDWGEDKAVSVRINALDTEYWYRDVVDVLENAAERLDLIMIPKVGCAADLYAVEAVVAAIEVAKGRRKRIGFEIIIETAAGIMNVEQIAAATRGFSPSRSGSPITPHPWACG